MLLTVAEAATILGVRPRTVRARLVRGALPGRKKDGRWVIPRAALPLTEAAHQALQARSQDVRTAVEAGLPSRVATRPGASTRSLADLEAFQAALAVRRSGVTTDPNLLADLDAGLFALAEGWHLYEPRPRLQALNTARSAFGRAVARLLMAASEPLPPETATQVAQLEQVTIAGIARLARSAERRR